MGGVGHGRRADGPALPLPVARSARSWSTSRSSRTPGPGELVTVVVPEIVPKHWWEHLLHNKTALYIRTAFLFRPRIVVTSVPFHLGAAHRLRDLLDHDEQVGEPETGDHPVAPLGEAAS